MNKKQASQALRRMTVNFEKHRYDEGGLLVEAESTRLVAGGSRAFKAVLYLEILPIQPLAPEMGFKFYGRIDLLNDFATTFDSALSINQYKSYLDLGEVVDELKAEFQDWYEDAFGFEVQNAA